MPDKKFTPHERVAFAKAINDRRMELGFTWSELGKKTGVSAQSLQNIAQSTSGCSLPLYKQLCKALRTKLPPLL
jgi:DNA-binding XRE family transcriptional regulator